MFVRCFVLLELVGTCTYVCKMFCFVAMIDILIFSCFCIDRNHFHLFIYFLLHHFL